MKISIQLGPVLKLTVESSLQLNTAKLLAYAELTNSEFNKISKIFPIFINLTSYSGFALMILKNQNSLLNRVCDRLIMKMNVNNEYFYDNVDR